MNCIRAIRIPVILLPLVFLWATGCRRESAIDLTSTREAGPLSAGIALGTNSMHVGDMIPVTLSVEHPTGGSLQIPSLDRGKELIVRDQSSSETRLSTNRVRTVVRYQVTSFVTGTQVLSSNQLAFVTDQGETLHIPFPFASLEVASVLKGADEQPRGIKGLARWPSVVPRWVWVFLLVALTAFLVGWAVRRWLSKPRTILNMPPPILPHEKALTALRELWARGWAEAGQAEPFYVALSGIVRQYIEERFNLKAPERTTEEFIREAAQSRLLSRDHQSLTHDFLEQCDLVKFARYQPQSDNMRAAFGSAERLVKETVPQPVSAPEVTA